MYHKFKATYDSNHDTFRIEFLVVPVGGLAFLVNHEFAPLEVHFLLSVKKLFEICNINDILSVLKVFL